MPIIGQYVSVISNDCLFVKAPFRIAAALEVPEEPEANYSTHVPTGTTVDGPRLITASGVLHHSLWPIKRQIYQFLSL